MAPEHGATARLVYENWHGAHGVDTDADRPWHRLIKTYLDPKCDLQGKRILEIGCGGGEFCCWLSKQPHRPAQIVGADFAATAVKKGRASALEQRLFGILWEVSDIQMLPFGDETFDTVISCETIEHVPDPPRAVRELTGVLKRGGHVSCVVKHPP